MGEVKSYELSDIDKMGFTKTVKIVFFYELQATVDTENLISSLLEGIRNATRQLPFMAGDLQFNEAGKLCSVTTADSEIDVNIRRFEPTECEPFSALAKGSFSPELDLTRFLPEEPVGKQPACKIQIGVIDGGLTLGLRLNHAAGDWTSLDTCLSLISQSTKAHLEGQAMPTYTPDLNRAAFNTPAPDPAITRADQLAKVPFFSVIEKSQFKINPPPPCRANIYRISEPTIQRLKAECTPHLDGVDYITSYDCISALIWTAITRARLHVLPDKSNAPTRFVHPIDVRTRDPDQKTSPQYFGNAVLGTLAGPLPAQDLIASADGATDAPAPARSLATAASLVRRSISHIDVSSFAAMTGLLASLTPTETLAPNADFGDMDLFMNTWYSGSVEKYDLGAGVVPAAVRVQAGMPGACASILPNFSRGGPRVFDVYVQAPVEVYEVLDGDEQFLKHFELVA
ncbi:uncharacterized protein BO95DRAFT_216068 [Aspergillus brunneoviolaceus CBS 621.78]|uniref:Uncharacterized protein n=1 Tax=Aspergillus brunneoviolaceus CBS 621.78 TaxID=1450534 RepID=A0ACD1G1L1_9EURO|nr:hypothetical protein BO95DRAFT_216068 [Aspergillus brunneoviolaceus CBS 621.78]RAH43116.1 hypothetical protein BO95DRAFT_216068 [Aspergillus brunneoviolaceus CBS 621.78]